MRRQWLAGDRRDPQQHRRKCCCHDQRSTKGESLLGCVGGYRIEGMGAQLFSAVEGNSFVVQGLPMFPLLSFLRTRALLAS
jgi:septum formation protein